MTETAKHALDPRRLEVRLAGNDQELEGAFRLRYEVFVQEERNMKLLNNREQETDRYDPYCDHLIVKDLEANRVIGTYRLLPGERALSHIGFYSESEFDLSQYRPFASQTLELGRSCIAPEYRNGRAIQLLWEGILQYAEGLNCRFLIGCASIASTTKTDLLEIYSLLHKKQVITDRYGVKPLPSHRIEGLGLVELAGSEKDVFRKLPPLMKGYQWLGAEIAGEPAYDPLFNTVDYFVVLNKEKMSSRYLRRFRQI